MNEVKSDHAERWDYIQELLGDTKPSQPEKKRRYIRRIDNDETYEHLWCVEIRFKSKGRYKKKFADKKNGGRSSALLAAISWRNKKSKEFGVVIHKDTARMPHNPDCEGVHQTIKKVKGIEYDVVVARWNEPVNNKVVRKTKTYYIKKYGLKRAIRLAKKYRKDKIEELYG